MSEALWAGLLLGLAAGLAPGPLLALTLTQSLQGGPGAGLRVALAPLLTDPPIIAVGTLAAGAVSRNPVAFGLLSLAGGAYVLRLAWETWASAAQPPALRTDTGGGLRRALLVNALNPHPYLFWLMVGGPLLHSAWQAGGAWAAGAFLGAFYLLLVGAKAALAALLGRRRGLLSGGAYRATLRALAAGLAVLALMLWREAALWLSGA